ncbi:Type IV pilus biogenesis factor PilY1 [Rhodocyclaceae bacterium]|nr:Type IV pilus biogenesis factor PilY1 [Rhodocyclaceae bacterium]
MKRASTAVLAFVVAALVPAMAPAAPDQYLGDASIYNSTGVQPNVLLIIDNSGSMEDKVPGEPYDPTRIYDETQSCESNRVKCKPTAVYTTTSKKTTNKLYINDVTTVTNSCGGRKPQDLLNRMGLYRGKSLYADGTCSGKGINTYYTGNYLNYLKTKSSAMRRKIDIAKDVVKDIIASTSGIKFGLMVYNYPVNTGQGGRFLEASVPETTPMYVSTVKDMDAIFTGSITNRDGLIAAVNTLTPDGNTPMGEALFEAMRYFGGGSSAFGNTIGTTGDKYTSPVDYSCQKNIIIFVSDGMSNADGEAVLKTLSVPDKDTGKDLCQKKDGDCDGDGVEPGNLNHILDDVALALWMSPQKVTSYFIGFDVAGSNPAAVALLDEAARDGQGKKPDDPDYDTVVSIKAGSQAELSAAFNDILSNLTSDDTSIAAPVVPVSPENRTYGSGRVFMGFFKPANDAFWRGNLKKYGVSSGNNPAIIDVMGDNATSVDEDSNGTDDNTGLDLPKEAFNGSLRDDARSYWSTTDDGSLTDKGGAGQLLLGKTASSRPIHTVTPTGTTLVDFASTNITPAMLGVTDNATRDELVAFVRGQDIYDEDNDGNTSENRAWTMGDVLHSKPLVVNYKSFALSNEGKCEENKSIIFVGANDGMLHAFRDCNGEELWGLIPPTLLPNLQYLADQVHAYFVDSTPAAYVHDVNKDGTIDPIKDKVILLFGTRRGGGAASTTATGSYFALDVSTPDAPKFLWRISNTFPTSGSPATPDFAELAESWSEPKIVRMKITTSGVTSDKIVAVIGAGYDNVNEDGRFGATQKFTGTATVLLGESGDGNATSSGTSGQRNPKGRGVYLVDLETGSKIHGFTYDSGKAPYSSMNFSFPSEIAAIDVNNNGYTSRLYAADTGGNIWRFDVGNSDKTNWTAQWLFASNPPLTADVGRKIFSKPTVVSEIDHKMIFFGTGDREHPLNTAVVDRIYAVKDKGQVGQPDEPLTEKNLMDVTADLLQEDTTDSNSISTTLNSLNASSNYGWYIRLEENDGKKVGEKVLGSPLVFNKVAYFTTHTPDSPTTSTDPCASPDNLGTARIYALNYKTGEAVLNYDKKNDISIATNKRAKTPHGILRRSDRVKKIGSGLPSGVGIMLTPGGGSKLLTGVNGAIGTGNPPPGGGIIPLYWRQK